MKSTFSPFFLFLLGGLFFLFPACTSSAEEVSYSIGAELSGFPDSSQFFLRNLSTDLVIDSAWLVGGSLQMKGILDETPEQLWFFTESQNEFVYTNLLIGNESVHLQADRSDFPMRVQATGSPTQTLNSLLDSQTATLHQERDSLVQLFFTLMNDGKTEEANAFWGPNGRIRRIDQLTDSLTLSFIKQHIDSYPALIQLGFQKNDLPPDTLKAWFAQVSPELQQSRFGRSIQVFMDHPAPQVDSTYYDFVAMDTSGQEHQLSGMLDKYVLLDFTGTYCGPCIQSMPELKEVQQEYADQLRVVSFSTDAGKDIWLTGVRRDQIEWQSLWDGKGNFSETKLKYGVSGIPHFFLISPAGTIVAIQGGYGEGLVKSMVEKGLTEG